MTSIGSGSESPAPHAEGNAQRKHERESARTAEHTVRHPQSRTIDKWLIGALGSVLGFLLSQWVALYQFSKTLETTKQIEMVHLARELTAEFFTDHDSAPLYERIRTTIESCGRIYKSNGGAFDNDQVNRYLGFFDDLGFYYRRGALDEESINQIFGAYIIEAYEYEELQKYIAELQRNANQQKAFVEFQALGELLSMRFDRKALAASFPAACRAYWNSHPAT